jgi:hypothetical protein
MDEYTYVKEWLDSLPVGPHRLDPDIHVRFQIPSPEYNCDSQNLVSYPIPLLAIFQKLLVL